MSVNDYLLVVSLCGSVGGCSPTAHLYCYWLIRVMLRNSGGLRSYRSEAVAVQTVSVMIPLDPEVTVGNADVSVLVAQSPEGKRKRIRFSLKTEI